MEQYLTSLISRPSERGETTTLTVERRGLFDVSVYKILEEDLLGKETVFGCEVSLRGTKYSVIEETMYFPGRGKKLKNVVIILFSWISFFFFSALPDHIGKFSSVVNTSKVPSRLPFRPSRGNSRRLSREISPRLADVSPPPHPALLKRQSGRKKSISSCDPDRIRRRKERTNESKKKKKKTKQGEKFLRLK